MFPKATQFEKLLEAVPDALVGVDQKGVIRFVNRETETLFGYDRDQMIGEHIDTLVPEPLWQIYAEHRENYFADPRSRSSGLDLELSGRHQDGTEFPINISMSLIDTGDVLLVITGVGDVTRRQQAVKNAGLVEAIVESSDDAILGGTLDGIITSWNPAAERLYGYSRKEVLGKSGRLLFPEDHAGEMKAVMEQVQAGQIVEHLLSTRIRKDGTLVPVSITVAPIRDADGAVGGVSAVHRDVTEQVRTQRALAEASWQYRLLAENASDFVAKMSPDGVITWVSPSVTRRLGWAVEDLIGTRLVDLVHPDDTAATATPREAAYSAHEPATPAGGFLFRIRTKSGQYRWMSGGTTPAMDESGVDVGVVSGLRDVEDLVHAREAARAGEAALRATLDSLLDPHVRLDAVRNESGQIADFVYVDANPAACAYNRIDYEDLVGARLLDLQPGSAGAGLLEQYRRVVETGEPLVLDDSVYAQELLGGQERHYDVRAARIGDGLSYTWRDVTDRRQAFEAARTMAAIVENSDDAIIGSTLDGIITSWNPAAERMYGYSSKEIIGRSGSILTPEDQTSKIQDGLIKVSGGQTVVRDEYTVRHKDGTVFTVSVTVSPIRDEGATVVGVSGIHRDVTEQRQAFETAQRLAAIVESSDDAIIARTLEGIITSWNPAAEAMFGYSGAEVIGKSVDLLIPQDRIDEMIAILAKVSAGQHVDHLQTIRVRKDGTVFPVSLTVSPIRDAGGAIVGTAVISRDMTEQEHAAQYARSLIEAGLDSLVTISPEGKITDVNGAAVTATGVPREELIGTDFFQYFTDPNKAKESYQQILAQGSVSDYPLTLLHQDGTRTEVLCDASVYRDFNGTVLGVLAVARDAAKLRHQQRLSVQLQEALKSRVVIEQAKGITAQRHAVSIDQAYQLIRAHARNNNASLRTVAEAIVEVGLEV